MTVLILHDAVTDASRPDEQDALVQAREVAAALDSLGHRPRIRPVDLNLGALADDLRGGRPDVVFNLVESLDRQGRLVHVVPAVLDSLGIPYTGTTTIPMLNTSSKLVAKRLLTAAGIATPSWYRPGRGDSTLQLPCRCIVKSVWEEASVGIDDASIVDAVNTAQLDEIIAARAPQLGGEAFAEAFIEGREFNVGLLAGEGTVSGRTCPVPPLVLPPAEIDFIDFPEGKPRIVGYAAKWDDRSHEFHHTPRRFDFPDGDAPLLANLSQIAVDCWSLFDLAGYARVDFRVDSNGRAWVLEINANPCLSSDAGFMAAAGRAGLTLADVVERLVSAAHGPGGARSFEE